MIAATVVTAGITAVAAGIVTRVLTAAASPVPIRIRCVAEEELYDAFSVGFFRAHVYLPLIDRSVAIEALLFQQHIMTDGDILYQQMTAFINEQIAAEGDIFPRCFVKL